MDFLLHDFENRISRLEVDATIGYLHLELSKNNGSHAFRGVKLHLSSLSLVQLTQVLIRLREVRSVVTSSFDQLSSCLFAELRARPASPHHVLNELLLPLFALTMEECMNQHDSQIETCRFAKRVLDILPYSDSLHRTFALFLLQHSFQHQALAMDIMNRSDAPPEDVVPLAHIVLEHARQVPQLHRGIEDAVRRCAAGHFPMLNELLVMALWKYRSVLSAYKCAKRLRFVHPKLQEEGQRAQIRSLISLGTNRAIGYATLKPHRRLLVLAMLIEAGHHFSAKHLAREKEKEELYNTFGVCWDERECLKEEKFRLETCLQLPSSVSVHVLETVEDLLASQLANQDLGVLSMDAEWVPVLYEKVSPVQWIQFGRGLHDVFLLDVGPAGRLANNAMFHTFMFDLVRHEHEIVGFGLETDCVVLERSFPGEPWVKMLALKMRNLVGHNKNTKQSLKALCEEWLGKTLDKEQQMSLWSQRPLSPAQLRYAALDAHVLVLLYHYQQQTTALSGVPPASPPVVVPQSSEKKDNTIAFFCDEMLKRTTKMLRAVNIDCTFEPSSTTRRRRDAVLHRISKAEQEGRIFVTADVSLRGLSRHVYCLEAVDNEERFRELVKVFSLPLDPMSILLRCTMCNGPEFALVTREEARRQNPGVVTKEIFCDERIEEMWACTVCQSVVWQGPKYKHVQDRMVRLMESVEEM